MSEKTIAAQLVMKEIEGFRNRRAEIIEAARVANEKLAKEIETLRRFTLHGKATSGDPITDYFIAAFGCIDQEPTLQFRKVQERMNGKKNQLFLIIQREKGRGIYREGSNGMYSPDFGASLSTKTFLGILSDGKLVLKPKERVYGLPTESYIEVDEYKSTEKTPGPYLFRMFHGFDKLEKTVSAGCYSGLELEIVIGCDAVFAYSPYQYAGQPRPRHSGWVRALNTAIRKLGRNIPEAPEERALREAEVRKVLALLDGTRDQLKLLDRNNASKPALQQCKDGLRQVFDRAKEMGLGDHQLVKLVASERGW